MSYKTYPEYKNSNNIWAGKIPIHWEIHKIKNLIFFQEGPGLRNWQFTDDGVRVICVTNITSNGIDFSNYEKFISEDEYKQTYSHFTVDQGDLLLSSSGNSWGKVAEYTDDETVILNTSTIRINKNPTSDYELKQPYIKWALQSEYIREQLGLMMTGSCQPNFGPTHLAKVSILMPTIKEQQQIANYLDKKTAKIDETIAKNERLIELLEEKRTALINQVVTKGLNPDVPMKDSGVEWIGEIPEHWVVINLKKCCEKITDGSHFSPETTSEGKYYITVRNVLDDKIDFKNASKISLEDYKALKNNGCEPKKGDVLLSKDGTIGKCIIVNETNFVILSSLGLLRPNHLINSKYLRYYLLSDINIKQMLSNIRGSAIKRLTINIIKELLLILPSCDEQKAINNYLDPKVDKINNTIKNVQKNINLLEEYKTSLIHHVVTGKIDVRGEEI